MEKRFEDFLNELVSFVENAKLKFENEDLEAGINEYLEPKQPEIKKLRHYDEIAREMGIPDVNYGAEKQLEVIAEYYNKQASEKDLRYYPVWNIESNSLVAMQIFRCIYIEKPWFVSEELLHEAYEFNREIFQRALMPEKKR